MKKIFLLSFFLFSSLLLSQQCIELSSTLQLSNLFYINDIVKVTVERDFCFIAGKSNCDLPPCPDIGGFWIIDISNPSIPKELSFFQTNYVNDIKVYNGYAYIATSKGLQIIDIKNPLNPKIISIYNNNSYIEKVDVKNGFAYIIFNDRFEVLDIQNLFMPTILSFENIPKFRIQDLKVIENYAYLALGDDGLLIMDISDPSFAKNFLTVKKVGFIKRIDIKDNYLYYIGNGNFGILDISDLANSKIYEVSYLEKVGGYSLKTNDDLAVIGYSGFNIINISEPKNPTLVYSYEGKYNGNEIFLKNNLVFMPFFSYDFDYIIYLGIFDISNCENIKIPMEFIPVVANSMGAYGSFWKSDIILHNPNNKNIYADLIFQENGKDNTNALKKEVIIESNSSLKISNPVENLFGKENTLGAMRIEATGKVISFSITVNAKDGGIHSQFIPGYSIKDSFKEYQELRLIQLKSNNDFRTNIGFVNLTSRNLGIEILVYKENGEKIGDDMYYFLPFEFFQENDIIKKFTNENIENGYAIIKSSTKNASFFAYASVIDNKTNDSIFISPRN